MSIRKLCSQLAKPSNSLIIRKYFTNHNFVEPKLFENRLFRDVNHTVKYSQALGSLTKDQAHDLVFRLNDEERKILLQTLDHYNVSIEKDGLTCK